MRAEKFVQVEIKLIMSKSDAEWLRGAVQNPFSDKETQHCQSKREEFFAVLNTTLKAPS